MIGVPTENKRAIWKGALSFGMITFPVAVYGSTREIKPELHQYRKSDMSRIRHKKVCEADLVNEVPYSDITTGFDSQTKAGVVEISSEDIKSINIPSNKVIDIDCFVDEKEIDERLFEKPYFLEAGKGGVNAYTLLYKGLQKSGKVGIAKVALRNREYLVMVKANFRTNTLIMETLRFPHELILPDLEGAGGEYQEAELELIQQLIEIKSSKFNPLEYKDRYVEELNKVISLKVAGVKVTPKAEQPSVVVPAPDMLAQLRASVALLKGKPLEAPAFGKITKVKKVKAKTKV